MLVELGQVGDEVFDDVGVGERVDAGLVGSVWWDAACTGSCVSFGGFEVDLGKTYISMPVY